MGKKIQGKETKCVPLLPEDLSSGFLCTCHHGLDHAAKQRNDDLLFFKKNRYDLCSNNEESFILDPDSSMGNRIESITQRTEVIEGKNKVFFFKNKHWDIYSKNAHTPNSQFCVC